MEILQRVRVRGERWRVTDVRPFGACRLITLANGSTVRRVLSPFDDVDPIASVDRPRWVTARRWRRACRALIANDVRAGGLRAAAAARIDLMPHQLEPALAVLRGAGSRVLLADDVGLGKTVQAGLIVAELLARGCIDRVLVIAPAGVREQWCGELRRRFGIDAASADARALRERAAALPLGVNPWTTWPVIVASIDYVKRAEVLPAVDQAAWDVVVVDEAHAAAGDSDRRQAVERLAGTAGYVLLLTATPHNGDDRAFADLCRIGQIAAPSDRDPLVVFRRTRQHVRAGLSRRIHTLYVRPSPSERQMRDTLTRYRRAVEAEHGERALALAVLDKRACSSPWSLAQSIDRRLAALQNRDQETLYQMLLPLDDPDGERTADDAPPVWPADLALPDVNAERRMLGAIAAAAHAAARHDDSKVRTLLRFLGRVRQAALVFTEYRDTAYYIQSAIGPAAGILHGGMDALERRAALAAFTHDPRAILVATDAAGQGLNLHHCCRLVVNVELPWNPMRLEQRIGRVDRIGQERRVHAVHLVAAGTSEADLHARLRLKIERARLDINGPDPLGNANGGGVIAPGQLDLVRPALAHEAVGEASRIALARQLASNVRDSDVASRPLTMKARRRLRATLAGRRLLIFQEVFETANERVAESQLLPVVADRSIPIADVAASLRSLADDRRQDVERAVAPFWFTRARREQAIVDTVVARGSPAFQPALFDRRAERRQVEADTGRQERLHDVQDRIAAIARRSTIQTPDLRLLLVVEP